jgi:hypothetical protein
MYTTNSAGQLSSGPTLNAMHIYTKKWLGGLVVGLILGSLIGYAITATYIINALVY